jgi:hypothetical protein
MSKMRAPFDSEHSVKEIDSYLVRIYRREGDALAGLVEQVDTGKTAPFATLADLSQLLSGQRRFARSRRPVAATDTTPTQQPQKRAHKS